MKARRDLWKVPDRRSTEDGKEPDELVVWAEGTGHPAFSLQAAGAMAQCRCFKALRESEPTATVRGSVMQNEHGIGDHSGEITIH